MNLPELLAILVLIIGIPLNVLVTVLLWRRTYLHPRIRVLRERLIVEVAVLALVIVFSLIFLNNDRLPPWLTTDVTKVITRATVLALALVPALYWLWLYRRRS